MSFPDAPVTAESLRHVRTTQTYFGAILQCLLSARPLHNFFSSEESDKSVNRGNPLGTGGEIFDSYRNLSRTVASNGSEEAVIEAVEILARTVAHHAPQFRQGQAADACEFLLFLLDALHEDVNRILKKGFGAQEPSNDQTDAELAAEALRVYKLRNDSYVSDQIVGMFKSSVTCGQCETKNQLMETAFYFTLDLPNDTNQTTLDKCFEEFSKPRELSGDDAYFCTRCLAHVTARRTLTPYSYPEILIVHLKRAGRFGKKDTKVEFPIRDFVPPCSGDKSSYDLFAVCNHIGSAHAGTNTSLVKIDERWHSFSGPNSAGVSEDQLVTSDAYILFYTKKH